MPRKPPYLDEEPGSGYASFTDRSRGRNLPTAGPWVSSRIDTDLHTTREASAYLTHSLGAKTATATLEKLRCVGGGPVFCKFGGRSVLYAREELDRWARARLSPSFTSTAAVA